MKYILFLLLSVGTMFQAEAMMKITIHGRVMKYDANTITLRQPGGAKVRVPRVNYPSLKKVMSGVTFISVPVTALELKELNPQLGKR